MSEPIQNDLNPFKTTGTGTWFKFAKMFKIKKLCGKMSSRKKKKKKNYVMKKNFLLLPVYSVKLIKIQSGSGPNIW